VFEKFLFAFQLVSTNLDKLFQDLQMLLKIYLKDDLQMELTSKKKSKF
jgi:hypothetical protein